MFLERPQDDSMKRSNTRKMTLRISTKLWKSIQLKAKKEYQGKGKQSKLVNEALKHFFDNAGVDDIDWDNPSDDYKLINLLTQIKLGANMKELSPLPVQISLDLELYKKLQNMEIKIKSANKLLDTHIKPAIVRICLSQWMYVDKKIACPTWDKSSTDL